MDKEIVLVRCYLDIKSCNSYLRLFCMDKSDLLNRVSSLEHL